MIVSSTGHTFQCRGCENYSPPRKRLLRHKLPCFNLWNHTTYDIQFHNFVFIVLSYDIMDNHYEYRTIVVVVLSSVLLLLLLSVVLSVVHRSYILPINRQASSVQHTKLAPLRRLRLDRCQGDNIKYSHRRKEVVATVVVGMRAWPNTGAKQALR